MGKRKQITYSEREVRWKASKGEMGRQLQPVRWALPLTYKTAQKLLVRERFS